MARRARRKTENVGLKTKVSAAGYCQGCHKVFLGVLLLIAGGLLYAGISWPFVLFVLGAVLVVKGLWLHSKGGCKIC